MVAYAAQAVWLTYLATRTDLSSRARELLAPVRSWRSGLRGDRVFDDRLARAQSFRRKLMRPVATNLRVSIEGVETSDIEPTTLPNLFHGSPARIYGRYRGQGPAKAVVRAMASSCSAASSRPALSPGPSP